MTAMDIAAANARRTDGVDRSNALTGLDAALAGRIGHGTVPQFPDPKPVVHECPMCHQSSDATARRDHFRDRYHEVSGQWMELHEALFGAVGIPHTEASMGLRLEALNLLGEAMGLERADQLVTDKAVALSWVQEHLNETGARLASLRRELADHLTRRARIEAINPEMEELGSRLEAAQVRRAEATTLDERIEAESAIAGIERVIASHQSELATLFVPFNQSAVETNINAAQEEADEWQRLVGSPEDALRTYCQHIREKWGSAFAQALANHKLPLSKVAFDGR